MFPLLAQEPEDEVKNRIKLIRDLNAFSSTTSITMKAFLKRLSCYNLEVGSISDVLLNPIISHSPYTNLKKNVDKDLRVCIIKFNDCDYTDIYVEYLRNLDFKANNISHLIAITINDRMEEEPKWKNPSITNCHINAEVECNRNYLGVIILSILFDIVLYHAYGLSQDYDVRRKYKLEKTKFIHNTFHDEILSLYGNSPENLIDVKYLPLSYKYIMESNATLISPEVFEKLVNDFNEIFIKMISTIFIDKIIITQNKFKLDSNIFENNLPDSVSEVIEKNISKIKEAKRNYCLLCCFTEDSTEEQIHKICNIVANNDIIYKDSMDKPKAILIKSDEFKEIASYFRFLHVYRIERN